MNDASPALQPLPAYFVALDAAYVAYAEALRRRLAACRDRHRAVVGHKDPPGLGPPPLNGWWFGGKVLGDQDIFQSGDRSPAPNTGGA